MKVNIIMKVLFLTLALKKSILGETLVKLNSRQKEKGTTDSIIFLLLAELPLLGAKYILARVATKFLHMA